MVAKCDHLGKLRFSTALPYAFTEHGAVMPASGLNTPVAVGAGTHVVQAFVRLGEIPAAHKELAAKLAELEARVELHDENITVLFDAMRELMGPTAKPTKRIAFAVA